MGRTVTYYSNKHENRQLRLELTQTPDIATNTSSIYWKLISAGNTANATLYLVCATTVKINGEQVYYKGLTNWYGDGGSPSNIKYTFPACEGYKDGTITVKHNSDGSLSIPIYFKTAVFDSAYHKDYGGTWELESIPRGASITAAPNFTDDENPTVTYTNAAGNNVDALDIAIYDTAGSVSYAAYRAATKTGTSYTFSLTDAERKKLRQAATSNTLAVKFYLRTRIGDDTFYSSVEKTMTIANPNPTLNPTVVDSNDTTKALTGDANKLIKYYSNAYYTINAAAVKEASITSQSVTHNGTKKTTATGTYNAVENGTFVFSATDSRGNTTPKTVTKTMINYIKLTCNHEVKISTGGVATINANGNYFNGSFGAVSNTLTVQYRYKTQGGSYGSWTDMTVSKSGNTYTATASKSGLNYQTTYVFQCRAIDKINTSGVNTNELPTKALPVYDWGENDLQFNVPVIFAAGFTQSAALTGDEDEIQPTGDYVIAQGNNGSYAYRKWNSGLMEAWRSAASTVSVTSSNTSGALYFTDQVALTTNGEAAQFISLENIQISINKISAVGLWQPIIARSSVSNGAASVDVFFINTVKDATASIVPYVYFIGRWK